jgi:LmbE family N-acetylglucosaminyl deacetylase
MSNKQSFAHPDDEIIFNGGTLVRHATSGPEIMEISATDGEAGQIRDATITTRKNAGQCARQRTGSFVRPPGCSAQPVAWIMVTDACRASILRR